LANEYDSRLWQPPAPPSPYVTHADMAPVHTKIGSLEKGQEQILSTYGHLRGEMLSGFAEIRKAISDAAPAPDRGGVNLSMRELVLIAVSLVLAGAVLGRVLGIEQLMGG
jgi:hypothetical protein